MMLDVELEALLLRIRDGSIDAEQDIIEKINGLRHGLEDSAVFLGILAATYRGAGDEGMAKLLTTARNKATAALERAGFPFQEDPANPKGLSHDEVLCGDPRCVSCRDLRYRRLRAGADQG